MPYTYDVFFSYKRQKGTSVWCKGVKEKLEIWLEQELHRPAKIFFDTEDILTGQRWRQRIANGLNESRTMVCIWSPLYFRSKWCVAEWQTFEARAQQFNCDLVAPARFFDGHHFPPAANALQRPDFSNYTNTSPIFWNTEDAYNFEQQHLKPFATAVANLVRNAPEHEDTFPLVEDPDNALILQEPTILKPDHD